MTDATLDHLRHLVSFDTSNPPRRIGVDGGAIGYTRMVLEAAGCSVTVRDIDDGCIALLALRGEAEILFNAHLDTVPPCPGWTGDPFALRVADGRATGLGACDVKGSAAALLAAAEATDGPLAILLNTDEEAGTSRCIRAACRDLLPRHVEVVIVAEPTSLRAITAHRGIVSCELRFEGRAAHAAEAAALDANALHRAVRWAHAALTSDVVTGEDLRLNIGLIEGGAKANVAAAEARVVFGLRPRTEEAQQRGMEALAALALPMLPAQPAAQAPCERAYPGSRAPVAVPMRRNDFAVTARSSIRFAAPPLEAGPAATAAVARLGLEVGPPVDFWTEAALFAEAGYPAIVLGAGSIDQAHAPDEWVELAQLQAAAELYIRLVERTPATLAPGAS